MWYFLAGAVSFLVGLVVGWILTREAKEAREVNEDEMDEPSQR